MDSPYGRTPHGRHPGPTNKRVSGPPAKTAPIQGLADKLVQNVLWRMRTGGMWTLSDSVALGDGSFFYVTAIQPPFMQTPIVKTWIESPAIEDSFGQNNAYLTLEIESGILYYSLNLPDYQPVLLLPLRLQTERSTLNIDEGLDTLRITTSVDETKNASSNFAFSYRDYTKAALDAFSYCANTRNDEKTDTRFSYYWVKTGKLKQLLQSIVSRRNHTFPMFSTTGGVDEVCGKAPESNRFFSWYRPLFLGTEFGPAREYVGRCTFLYTVRLGLYYLIWINGSIIKARKLIAPHEAVKLVEQHLADIEAPQGSLEYHIYESYLLSVTDFDPADDWHLPDGSEGFHDCGEFDPLGNTIYHGWSASYGGKYAAAVTIEKFDIVEVGDTQFRQPPTLARLYKMEITGGDEDNPPQVSVAIIESSDFAPILLSNPAIWVPAPLGYGMESMFWYPRECNYEWVDGAAPADNVPLYCFFDRENALNVVRFSESSPADDSPDETPSEWAARQTGTWPTNGGGEYIVRTDQHSITLQISKTSYSDETLPSIPAYTTGEGQVSFSETAFVMQGTGTRYSMSGSLTSSVTGCSPTYYGAGFIDCYPRPEDICKDNWPLSSLQTTERYLVRRQVESISSLNSMARCALVIPEEDPDACYIFGARQEQELKTVIDQQGGRNVHWIQICSGLESWQSWTLGDSTGLTGTIENINRGAVRIEGWFCDRFGVHQYETLEAEAQPSSELEFPNRFSTLFFPIICGPSAYPLKSGWWQVRSSVLGAKFFYQEPCLLYDQSNPTAAIPVGIGGNVDGLEETPWRDYFFVGWQ